MKKFVLLLSMLYSLSGIAQTITEKYNSLQKRYEYFNSSGNLIGYKTYDSLKQTWNYYEAIQKQQNNYVEPINLELINKALASKQARLDNNVQKIEYAIQDISDKIMSLDVEYEVKNRINDRFTNMLNNLNTQRLNYNSTSVSSQTINWLYTEINRIIPEETNRIKSISQKTNLQNVKNGTYVTLFRKATIWDSPEMTKAKSLGQMETNVVYVIEKTNSQFYKIKSGNIIGYVTAQNFKE